MNVSLKFSVDSDSTRAHVPTDYSELVSVTTEYIKFTLQFQRKIFTRRFVVKRPLYANEKIIRIQVTITNVFTFKLKA